LIGTSKVQVISVQNNKDTSIVTCHRKYSTTRLQISDYITFVFSIHRTGLLKQNTAWSN